MVSILNAVTLSKGIKYLSQHVPETIPLVYSRDKQKQEEKLLEFKQEMNSLDERTVQNAKSGDLESCYALLRHLHRIWNTLQKQPEESQESAPKKAVQEDYIPTERTLRPMVRWLLMKVKSLHLGSTDTLEHWIENCSTVDHVSIPSCVLDSLCSCVLYSFLDSVMLQKQDEILDLSIKETNFQFLDHLMELGLLNIQSNTIKDMIQDQNPFYESIHINIISAFMEWETKSYDMDELVTYMDRHFVGFDSGMTYPFDMEDCLTMWMNQCFPVLYESYGLEDLRDYEFEDVAKDLDDGWMLPLLIGHYFQLDVSQIIAKKHLNSGEKQRNYEILQTMLSNQLTLGIHPPWLPNDLMNHNPNRNASQRFIYAGNASYLFNNFLVKVFDSIVESDLPFPVLTDRADDQQCADISSAEVISSELGQRSPKDSLLNPCQEKQAPHELRALEHSAPRFPEHVKGLAHGENFDEALGEHEFHDLEQISERIRTTEMRKPQLIRQDAMIDLPVQAESSLAPFQPVEDREEQSMEERNLNESADPMHKELTKEEDEVVAAKELSESSPDPENINTSQKHPEVSTNWSDEPTLVSEQKKALETSLSIPLSIPPITPDNTVALACEGTSKPKKRKKKMKSKAIEEHINSIMERADTIHAQNDGVYEAPGIRIVDSFIQSQKPASTDTPPFQKDFVTLPKLISTPPTQNSVTFMVPQIAKAATPPISIRSTRSTPTTKFLPPLELAPSPVVPEQVRTPPRFPTPTRRTLPELVKSKESTMNDLFSNLEKEIDEIAHQLEEQQRRSAQNTPIGSQRQDTHSFVVSGVNEAGTIMINQSAISMLLDSETESEAGSTVDSTETGPKQKDHEIEGEFVREESADTELEDSASSVTEQVDSYQSAIEEISTASFFLSKPKPIVFQSTGAERDLATKSPTNFVSRPRSIPESESETDSHADIIEIYEKPSVQTPPPREDPIVEIPPPRIPSVTPSRPRTGLQSYPIPETDEEIIERHEEQGETTWDRVKSHRRVSRSSPLKKPKKETVAKQPERDISSAPKFIAKTKLTALEKPKIQLKKELVSKSNRTLVKNALMHVCLAGSVNRSIKDEVLKVLIP
jgi:hypothetical protein